MSNTSNPNTPGQQSIDPFEAILAAAVARVQGKAAGVPMSGA